MTRSLLAGLLVLAASTPALANDGEREIHYLLESVGASGCSFTRNGSQHTAPEAEAHLAMKYQRAGSRIETAEQFIEHLASQSSFTGVPYSMRCADTSMPSRDWLTRQLERYRAGGEDTTDAPANLDEPVTIPAGSGRIDDFLGCEHPDGSTRESPVTAAEMPWRVAIGLPRSSPKYGSRQQARDAAVAAMEQWERAIRTRVPWFEFDFVDRDDDAPVQIEWKRRITGKAAGRGGPVCFHVGESVRAGGRMEIAVRSCPTCTPLTVDQVKALVAHEFGHILGLGHCLECDSAMNYSWHTRDRIFVTQTDVDAIAQLLAPNEGGDAGD